MWVLRNKLLIGSVKVGIVTTPAATDEDLGANPVVFLYYKYPICKKTGVLGPQ
jgi:hypothetical protein